MRDDLVPQESGEYEGQRDVDPGVSDRSRLTTMLLGGFLGIFGAHRFYAGKPASGVAMLCTLGGLGLWWLADCLIIATGEFRDGDGRKILRWGDEAAPAGSGQRADRLLSEVESVRSQMQELEERVDFMERLLTQARDAGRLPR